MSVRAEDGGAKIGEVENKWLQQVLLIHEGIRRPLSPQNSIPLPSPLTTGIRRHEISLWRHHRTTSAVKMERLHLSGNSSRAQLVPHISDYTRRYSRISEMHQQ